MSIKGGLVGICVAAVTWLIVVVILEETGMDELALVIVAIIPAAIAGWLAYKGSQSPNDKTWTDAAAGASSSIRESVETVKARTYREEDFDAYAVAEKEIEEGTYNQGLWSKALVDADGDYDKRPTVYMKLRAAQLQRRCASSD